MKRFATTASIMAVVLFIGVLGGMTDPVLAQRHFGGHDGKRFLSDLTDEQRAAVHEKREEMRSQGATGEEIHNAISEMLEGYGIEVPEFRQGHLGFGHRWHGFGDKLTDEQREAFRDKIEQMRNQGVTRQGIRAALGEMLKGYGIEVPEDWHGPFGFGHRRFGLGADLTQEQQEAVCGKIKELRGQGATREQIHTEVAGMLKGFGIEVPQDWRGPLGPGHKRFGFRSNLSDEQREALREKIKEMRNQGASREDVHAAIAEMIKGFRAEQPENPESTPSKTETAQSHITAQSYPNPFNPEADIAYALGVSENVRIQIYNVSGQLIRTFDMGHQTAGNHTLHWDGRNENGDVAASGVYLYRIQAGPYQVTNRMVLLK